MTDKIFRISVCEQCRLSSWVQEQHGLVFLKRSVHESNRSKKSTIVCRLTGCDQDQCTRERRDFLDNALRVGSRIRLLQRHDRIEIGGVGVPLESLG